MLGMHLTYGLTEGRLAHISDVPRGATCNCVCPACGDQLVAKKGALRHHHFAHASGAECNYAVETALHMAAKSILERRRELVLPAVSVTLYGLRPPAALAPERRYSLDNVVLERKAGHIVPDVMAYHQGRPLIIEVRVTHEVDEKKMAKIRALGLSAIEIDLSRAARTLSIADLERLIVEGGEHKAWLHNVAAERKRGEILSTGRLLRTRHRGLALHVDGCPIKIRVWNGEAYANVVDDCTQCEYALHIGPNMNSVTCRGFAMVPEGEVR